MVVKVDTDDYCFECERQWSLSDAAAEAVYKAYRAAAVEAAREVADAAYDPYRAHRRTHGADA